MDFIPWSLLSQWLPAWKEADIKYVPINYVGQFPIADYLEWVGDIKQDTPVSMMGCEAAANALLQSPPTPAWVFRWDQCAPIAIKSAVGRGLKTFEELQREREYPVEMIEMVKEHWGSRLWQSSGTPPPQKPFREMLSEDTRLYEVIKYDNENNIVNAENGLVTLFWRPWQEPLVFDTYAVEFRVFVVDGQAAGVSTYYPHNLPAVGDGKTNYLPLARRVVELTEGLIPYAVEHFTADWIVTPNHDVVLLECGPPHFACDRYWGVDSCNFPRGDTEGILLGCDGERFPLKA